MCIRDSEDAGFGGDAREVHMLFARADGRLHDRMQTVGYGGHAHDGGLRIGGAAIAGEFGHGLAVDVYKRQGIIFDSIRISKAMSDQGLFFHGRYLAFVRRH